MGFRSIRAATFEQSLIRPAGGVTKALSTIVFGVIFLGGVLVPGGGASGRDIKRGQAQIAQYKR